MSPVRRPAEQGSSRLSTATTQFRSGTPGFGSAPPPPGAGQRGPQSGSPLARGMVPAAFGHPVWLVRALVFLGLAVLLVVLAGCTNGSSSSSGDPAPAAGKDSSPTAHGSGPAGSPDPVGSDFPTPSSSSDDPDSTQTAEPDDDSADDGDPDGTREVPVNAMLDAATVGAVAGGSWSEAAGVLGCGDDPAPEALDSRALGLTAKTGSLIEVVGTYGNKASARAAITAAAAAIEPCGYAEAGDPRIGDASLEMAGTGQTGPDRMAVVIAAESVLVVLVADGSAARPGTWESLADLALGTSCAAAAHACH